MGAPARTVARSAALADSRARRAGTVYGGGTPLAAAAVLAGCSDGAEPTPAGGFTRADWEAFAAAMDTLVYPVDVLNFGEPTDIDGNGRVFLF